MSKSPLYQALPSPIAWLTALCFSRNTSSDFLFCSVIFLQLFTTGYLVHTAVTPPSDFNSRKSNVILDRKFLTEKNYSTPTQLCPAGARVSYFLLHKTPTVSNPKSHSMCLTGFSLSWHAGLQPPAWFSILGKLLHFCEVSSVQLEHPLRLHRCLPLPPQERPC